jgi:hypothetical protein
MLRSSGFILEIANRYYGYAIRNHLSVEWQRHRFPGIRLHRQQGRYIRLLDSSDSPRIGSPSQYVPRATNRRATIEVLLETGCSAHHIYILHKLVSLGFILIRRRGETVSSLLGVLYQPLMIDECGAVGGMKTEVLRPHLVHHKSHLW